LEPPQGYRFLEHVTDALAEAWGRTIEDAFSQAGLALFDTMLDTKSVKAVVNEEIETIGHDEKELLYNYLEELLLLFEIKQFAVGTIRVISISNDPHQLKLEGQVSGERYDPKRHHGKVEVKGITYHLMEIENKPAKTTLRFLVDL
jgi:SHS2 domain-containing protein